VASVGRELEGQRSNALDGWVSYFVVEESLELLEEEVLEAGLTAPWIPGGWDC